MWTKREIKDKELKKLYFLRLAEKPNMFLHLKEYKDFVLATCKECMDSRDSAHFFKDTTIGALLYDKKNAECFVRLYNQEKICIDDSTKEFDKLKIEMVCAYDILKKQKQQ